LDFFGKIVGVWVDWSQGPCRRLPPLKCTPPYYSRPTLRNWRRRTICLLFCYVS